MTLTSSPRRWLFTLAIFTGSFLLFLVQPMVARMALPQLGGAPNVWNSAMLVYQALLLCGYAYAHWLGRLPVTRQGQVHLVVLVMAGFSLPLALADIAQPAPGWEALWVPWLFLLTVGPAFFAVSAQAPLVQRWYAAHPEAEDPYPLYAASNLGSFGGLIAYPLLAEPLLPLGTQSFWWSLGYVALVLLVAALVWARRGVEVRAADPVAEVAAAPEPVSRRRIALWLALSAVPSGLMLSSTTYLTTDIMAMPLLWVIPLGLYLLSFSIAFAARRTLARWFTLAAPVVLLVGAAVAMKGTGQGGMMAAIASIVLLFVTAVALHARLYEDRPEPAQLTRFYLVMSAGGAIGGVFTALLAPVLFDWTWEHPLLILAAAVLLPLSAYSSLLDRWSIRPALVRWCFIIALAAVWWGGMATTVSDTQWLPLRWLRYVALAVLAGLAIFFATRRFAFVAATFCVLATLGGLMQARMTWEDKRTRSYFGVYSVLEHGEGGHRLFHGTTTHGLQLGGERRLEPTSYYGRSSGVGQALLAAPDIFGAQARVGVVGLGVGTLACYRQPGQRWTFFEIDPAVLQYSRSGTFTFLSECAPDARIRIGDARLELDKLPDDSFDVLAVDAFSSDAIPLHLLTDEALQLYTRVLAEDGLLLIHISNRFIRLEPVLDALAKKQGLHAASRRDEIAKGDVYASNWVVLSRDAGSLRALTAGKDWVDLSPAEGRVWTDDYASILPYMF